MKKIISLLLSFCIVLSIGFTPATAATDQISLTPIMEETNFDEFLENEVSSGQDGYTYHAPKPGLFMIENASGVLSVTHGTPTIQFANATVNLPSVDYYKIVDKNGTLRFYQADVLEDPALAGNFMYIAIYVDSDAAYTFHVQYLNPIEERMYNIVVPLSLEQFAFFNQISTPHCIGTDDISSRLKLSARAYSYGSFKQDMNIATYNSTEPMALNPITNGTYDWYTDDDGIIHDYVDEYFGECYLEDGSTYTDDPIVYIIPKALFFTPGEHIYVGKEYGFFLRVVDDSYSIINYNVDVMVFDITHTTPGFLPRTDGKARIDPLFQFKYRATNGTYDQIDSSLDRVVIPHIAYDYAEYFLKDVGFKFTLENVDALNPGETGYDPYEDDGAFITNMSAEVNGTGLRKWNHKYEQDIASFVIGFIPIAGTVLSLYSFGEDLYNGFSNEEYYDDEDYELTDNSVLCNAFETNNTDQIAAYGGLVKSHSVWIKSSDEKPRLIQVGEGFAEVKYMVSHSSYSDNNKIRVITSINVNVVAENDAVIPGLTDIGITDYGSATGTHETGNYRRLNDTSPNGIASITIPASMQKHVIKLTPLVSGSYKILATNNGGDPNFCITNATKGTATVAATDDISPMDSDAELIIDLIAGDIYYLEVYNYNKHYGCTLRIGYNPVSSQILEANTPYYVTTTKGTFQMLKFTPTVSGYYEISTNRVSGDPQMFIFLVKGGLWDSDDDSGGNLNSYLRLYMSAGVTFYIAVQGYRGNAATFSITATLQE